MRPMQAPHLSRFHPKLRRIANGSNKEIIRQAKIREGS